MAECRKSGLLVLKTLSEQGELSMRGLQDCIFPRMNREALKKIKNRLERRELITRRDDKIFGGAGVFYQIARDDAGLKKVAHILSTDISKVIQPLTPRSKLLHSEDCAVWACTLKHLFPEAGIYREHQFSQEPLIAERLMSFGETPDLLPDIVLLAKGAMDNKPITIAIEIERVPKTDKRLIRKLRKYARESRLDGVIYICDKNSLSERIRQLYNKNVINESPRIKHYWRNFFLLGTRDKNRDAHSMLTYNAALEPASMTNWIRTLIATSHSERNDKIFSERPLGGTFANAAN